MSNAGHRDQEVYPTSRAQHSEGQALALREAENSLREAESGSPQTLNDSPQPHVFLAFGFVILNPESISPSL